MMEKKDLVCNNVRLHTPKANMKILFICYGNICRSPAAEGIFNHLIKKEGLEKHISCESAGTSQFHAGHPADHRMRKYASQRGYSIESTSRPFRSPQDFSTFDILITMDNSNFENILSLTKTQNEKNKVKKMVEFLTKKKVDYIPDPYYKEEEGFTEVLDLLEEACSNLLKHIKAQSTF